LGIHYPRVGVGVIILRNNRILLIRRKNVHGAGSWSTPGGHLDYGETPEQCAIRETKEEVGLELTDIHFVALTNDFFPAETKHYITVWVAGRCDSSEPRIAAAYEVAEFDWFDWDGLPQPLFVSFDNLLNHQSYPPDAISLLKKNLLPFEGNQKET
jgi:8-oxo-dGTP diphosphatase